MNEENLAREAKNQYMREWRKKNPERVKATNQRYWTRRGKAMRQKSGGAAQTDTQEN